MSDNAEKDAGWVIEGRYPDEEWYELLRKSCKEYTAYDAGMFQAKNPGLEVRVRRLNDGTD